MSSEAHRCDATWVTCECWVPILFERKKINLQSLFEASSPCKRFRIKASHFLWSSFEMSFTFRITRK